MNILLVIFKGVVGFLANSIAIILDAVNNLTDVISAVVTIIGTKLATKKADKEHPYGHGRIEYIAATIVSFIILFAGITAIKESIDKIIHPLETNYSYVSIIIIVVAVLFKIVFGIYASKVGKKYDSNSLVATGKDALMDAILSTTTIIAAIISLVFKIKIEGYLGLLISIFILKAAIEILVETKDSIVGTRFDKEYTDKIKSLINSYDEVRGVYDLILHNYGPLNIIGTANIEVRHDMTAEEIHKLSKKISNEMFEKYNIILTVGIYAYNDSGKSKEIRKELNKILSEYTCIKQIHGFFVDEQKKQIYFDLIIDFEEKNPEKVKEKIIEKMKINFNDYEFYVVLDTDFTD